MIKSIRIWWLKVKLAGVFKQAEHLQSIGVEAGDQRYISLYDQASSLVKNAGLGYVGTEIPAMHDLQDLTIAPVKKPLQVLIGMYLAIGAGAGFAIGMYAQVI